MTSDRTAHIALDMDGHGIHDYFDALYVSLRRRLLKQPSREIHVATKHGLE